MADLTEGHAPPRPPFAQHPSDDELELYSMGRTPEPECVDVEEHLLVCVSCQDRLRASDEFVALMKEATKEIVRREAGSLTGSAEQGAGVRFQSAWNFPSTFAALAVVLVLAVGITLYGTNPPPIISIREATVELVAVRGADAPSVEASAAASLRLLMDTAGTPSGHLDIALVAADGTPVWTGVALSTNDRATAVVNKNLRPGQYFARISANSTLLREFTFHVR